MDFSGFTNFFNPQSYDQNDFDYKNAMEDNQRKQALAQQMMNFSAGGQMQNVNGYLVGGNTSPLKAVLSTLMNVAGAKTMASTIKDKKQIDSIGREVYKQGIELVRNNGFDQENRLQNVLKQPAAFVGQDLGFLGVNDTTDAERVRTNANAQLEALRAARSQGLDTLRRANPSGGEFAKLFETQEIKNLFPTEKAAPIQLARGAQLVSPSGQVLASNANTDNASDIKIAGQRQLADGNFEVMLSNGERFIANSPYRVGDPILNEGQSVQAIGARDKPIVLSQGQTAVSGDTLARSGGEYRADYTLSGDEQRYSGRGIRLNSGVVRPTVVGKDQVAIDPITGQQIAAGPAGSSDKTTKDSELVRVAAQNVASGLQEIRTLNERFIKEGTYDKATGAITTNLANATGGVLAGGTLAAQREIDKIKSIALGVSMNVMKANGLSPGQVGNTAVEQQSMIDRIFALDYRNMTPEQLKRQIADGMASLTKESEALAQRILSAGTSTGLPITGMSVANPTGVNTGSTPPSGLAPSWDRNRR